MLIDHHADTIFGNRNNVGILRLDMERVTSALRNRRKDPVDTGESSWQAACSTAPDEADAEGIPPEPTVPHDVEEAKSCHGLTQLWPDPKVESSSKIKTDVE